MHVISVQTSGARGGSDPGSVDLLDGLAARGVRTTLVTNLPELAEGSRVPVRSIPLGPGVSKPSLRRVALGYPGYAGRLLLELRSETHAGPADALLLHHKKEQLMTSTIPGWVARRVVWAERRPLPEEFRTGVGRAAYVASARRASHVVCLSEETRQTVVDAGVPSGKCSVIPDPVEVRRPDVDAEARARLRAEWGAGDATLVVGVVAPLRWECRNDVVVDALGHLPPDADVLVVLAGSGPDESPLRDRARDHAGRVRFVPEPRTELEGLLSACDVHVFTPPPGEAPPRSVVLSQLLGRPVIATDATGAADVVAEGTGTVLVPPHDPEGLAGALEAYRQDPERRAREGAAARAHALDRHDPAPLLDLWQAVLEGRAAG